MRYVIVNIKGDIIEEFETIREAEECLEYLSKWHDDYNIEQISEADKKALINCSKSLIKTNEQKYVSEATTILAKYYKIENIEEIYNSQKSNRLKYEL